MTRIEETIAESSAIDVNSALTTFVGQCRADWEVEAGKYGKKPE